MSLEAKPLPLVDRRCTYRSLVGNLQTFQSFACKQRTGQVVVCYLGQDACCKREQRRVRRKNYSQQMADKSFYPIYFISEKFPSNLGFNPWEAMRSGTIEYFHQRIQVLS